MAREASGEERESGKVRKKRRAVGNEYGSTSEEVGEEVGSGRCLPPITVYLGS